MRGTGARIAHDNTSPKLLVRQSTRLRFEANFFSLFNHTNFAIQPAQKNLATSNFGGSTATFARISSRAVRALGNWRFGLTLDRS